MTIRIEQPGDREAVRDLHLHAFGDHGKTVAELVGALRATVESNEGFSLVAERAGEVAGHVMFTRRMLDAPRRLVEVQVLSPLAVRPDHQGRGIGSALVRSDSLSVRGGRPRSALFHHAGIPA
ncbi:N-acetyltransferase [Actinoallomurus sp. NPDC050550]|uniref:GNAT family N-acetyltransferase n=1 Tax=Actinoallomurus sp. NPDC050550 TaxID=3154937 RepID=UPI0033E2883B